MSLHQYSRHEMSYNKYHEMDKLFCEFVESCINTPGLMSNETKEIYKHVRKVIIENPDELEEVRGKYILFQDGEYIGYCNNFGDIQDDPEIKNAIMIFIPNEHRYCNTAQMPYRQAIDDTYWEDYMGGKRKESWFVRAIRSICKRA
jgi:hypothetical protein